MKTVPISRGALGAMSNILSLKEMGSRLGLPSGASLRASSIAMVKSAHLMGRQMAFGVRIELRTLPVSVPNWKRNLFPEMSLLCKREMRGPFLDPLLTEKDPNAIFCEGSGL